MVKIFKNIAILEGISYLALFANMLLVKPTNLELYKTFLYPIGMTHGVLFIGYVALAFLITKYQKWSFGTLSIVLIASLLPLATFFVERKYVQVPVSK
jgi:integral membrane protein